MRDLLLKAITSTDRKKRVLASSEILDKEGVRSVIHRHFICRVQEVKDTQKERPLSRLYVLKEINHKEQKEKFFCRMKGSMYVISGSKILLVYFQHSLKIILSVIPQNLVQENN